MFLKVLTKVSLLLKAISSSEHNVWLSFAPKMVFSDIQNSASENYFKMQAVKTVLLLWKGP